MTDDPELEAFKREIDGVIDRYAEQVEPLELEMVLQERAQGLRELALEDYDPTRGTRS